VIPICRCVTSRSLYVRMQTARRVAANPQTKPVDLGCESAENWQLSSASTIAVVIITQPVSWHSFYRPTKGGRLSRPKHCSKGEQSGGVHTMRKTSTSMLELLIVTVVKFEEINLKFEKVRDPYSITTVIGRHSVLSILWDVNRSKVTDSPCLRQR